MTEIITSTQNQHVKLAHNLQNKARTRRKERKIVLEGTRLIGDATAQGYKPLYVLYETSSADYNLIAELQNFNVTLIAVSADVMQHISDTQQPQGIVAVYPLPMPRLPQQAQRLVILDAVREPGNLGTILRTAAASGVQVVLLAPGCVDPYNPKVLRAGMGAHFRVPVIEAQWAQIAEYTQTIGVYLAAGNSEKVYTEIDWRQAWALVIGNEAHGISEANQYLDATPIRVPMAAATESLNAAVATGVILFEAQRQRSNKP